MLRCSSLRMWTASRKEKEETEQKKIRKEYEERKKEKWAQK